MPRKTTTTKRPRRRKTGEEVRPRAASVLKTLRREFPAPKTALDHQNPFQLLIATILSAQCTDERVNIVTKDLFARYPSPADLASVSRAELETIIRSTGFYRMKAKSVIACSKGLIERHGGKVPDRLEDLVQLAGVGRKTANVVLGQAFGIASGVVVDTHVFRLSQRLGFTNKKTAEDIETDLMALFPKKDWIDVGTVLILHGRRTCKARKPECGSCPVNDRCPSAEI